jgi:hypothetical protein
MESTATEAPAAQAMAVPEVVRLIDANDPFGQSLRDCLLGLGLALHDAAACAVLVGAVDAAVGPQQQRVAVGDAALHLLGHSGFAVQPIPPEHGRVRACTPTADAPWTSRESFATARYASLALLTGDLPAGWLVWVRDERGQAVALAHGPSRTVCLLFRPDSLLSDPQALQVLRAALAFAAGTPQSCAR